MLQILINLHSPDAICIQETNFKDFHYLNLKSYNIYHENRTDRDHASGEVAIYLKSHLFPKQIPLNTTLEAVAVEIGTSQKMHLCSIYIPPNCDIEENDLRNLIDQILSPKIILGDFNGHNIIWRSQKTTPLGKKIANSINSLNLALLNNGANTHFNLASGSSSAIDLSLCSPSILFDHTWRVAEDLHGSDHFPIMITNNSSTKTPHRPYTCWTQQTGISFKNSSK
ncbi:hypothetical protein JTB14_011076 [Gonioctena quinquepunctata]|nr:hypothetical protein JTB14_011076 [Gonioctena quinquepunctata]